MPLVGSGNELRSIMARGCSSGVILIQPPKHSLTQIALHMDGWR